MNLRKAEYYSIGLDLGTGSVGWAVVDENGRLYHIKGKPTWGSRLFPSAETAADTRLKRGQRRRYDRRRQRLNKLQELFFEEMDKVDPEFFIRLRQSRLWKGDRAEDVKEYRWPLFNGSDFTEADYYREYPTIYHLRNHLIESEQKEDIRLIYLALHNIVKYRGNFLHEDEGSTLSAANANAEQSAKDLVEALSEYLSVALEIDSGIDGDITQIRKALDDRGVKRGDRVDRILAALNAADSETKKRCKAIARACVGYKVEYADIFEGLDKGEGTSFSFSDEEKPEAFLDDICPDDGAALFEGMQAAYSAYVLSGILQGAAGISEAMVRSYERHANDLKILKELFNDHLSKEAYRKFFKGAKNSRGGYDINKLASGTYTSYIEGEKKANKLGTTHEDLLKAINKICSDNPGIKEDPRYREIADRLEAGEESDFLGKQKTRANGAIPYQLHLEEMDRIIESQGRYYPFLLENREVIEKLVSSRIPYYVGPLNFGRDPLGDYPNNPIDSSRKFAWAKRKPGTEGERVYPWNYEDIVDTDETAESFIRRMTGTCTYLYGEDVLPKRSLLYEEFCVLNELNGARWGDKGERHHRFDHEDKRRIFEELFKKRKSVSFKNVQDWLKLNAHDARDPEVAGGQGETGFESKLTTYHDFCTIFSISNLEDAPLSFDELEEIVLWNTVFEDRSIFKRKLMAAYGPDGDGRLSKEQIKKLVAKRYSGWGNLSKKLLTGIRAEASVAAGSVSIMDVLRNGNPFDDLRQLVFMEVLADKDLCFQNRIDEINKQYFRKTGNLLTIEDMQGSPANRRAVNQAMRILDEIIGIAGKDPARICIEVTRDDDWKKKGSRTKSRYKQLKEALNATKADMELLADLDEKQAQLDDDRLMLYFEQQGKCMYSGEPLDLNLLSTYHIDHVVPQSLIKDDSLDNKVLVKAKLNERKLADTVPSEIRKARYSWWKSLNSASPKLLSDKKFRNLTTAEFTERQLNGFINRQLVETSQIVKFVRQMCEQRYPNTEIVSVRANTSHGVRENLGLVKCRELNNFHHAHDAFIACQVADYVERCYPDWQDGIKLAYIQRSIKNTSNEKGKGVYPGKSGFIADGLCFRRNFDEETGEIIRGDKAWDNVERCEYIRKALGYKDCFISRMVIEQSGAFWKETLISPFDTTHNPNALANPKRDLPAEHYGGYEKPENAYAVLYASIIAGKTPSVRFREIPISIARTIKNSDDLVAHLLAVEGNVQAIVILREHICINQPIEYHGNRYLLGGKTGNRRELLLGTEPSYNAKTATQIDTLLHSPNNNTSIDYKYLYSALVNALDKISSDLASVLSLGNKEMTFSQLPDEEKREVIKNLVNRLSGNSRDVDLKLIGGSGQSGKFAKAIANELPQIIWVDQSVTGIFEKRTTFEDLTHGL